MKTTLAFVAATVLLCAARPFAQAAPAPSPAGKAVPRATGSAKSTKATPARGKAPASAARLAAESPALRTAVLQFDTQAAAMRDGSSIVADAVAWQTKVPVKTLTQQQTSTGLTYGELLVANSLAAASNKRLEAILALKATAKNWSDLSRQLKINPDSIVGRARAASESLRVAAEKRGKPPTKQGEPIDHGLREDIEAMDGG